MFRMINPVRDYAWGSRTAMAERFSWPYPEAPQAEIWMGDHPAAPSAVELDDGSIAPLTDLLSEAAPDGEAVSGAGPGAGTISGARTLSDQEGRQRLPFLVKVLAAERPLSIQTHPCKHRAEEGFASENASGVAMDAFDRNYKDDNHKPELIVALSEFSALCGFREYDAVAVDLRALETALIQSSPAQHSTGQHSAGQPSDIQCALRILSRLAEMVAEQDYRAALALLLGESREEASRAVAVVSSLLVESSDEHDGGLASDLGLDSATAVTLRQTSTVFPGDPGVLVTLLMRRIELHPGEALYLPAGNLHAYLRGLGVEVMASSDNVLRGGLTDKHVDVTELLDVTEFQVLPAPYCAPQALAPGHMRYTPDMDELRLEKVTLTGGEAVLEPQGAAILLCTQGMVHAQAGGREQTVSAGESIFLPPGSSEVRLSLPQDELGGPAAERLDAEVFFTTGVVPLP